ncbi:MAG: type II secretion system F family protein [Oscillibacter sp.]|nr:type II secretion system F family protein [Oscillibacter sp.]
MPVYNYKAVNRSGKTVKDSLDAASLDSAKSSLRSAGYTILDIREQNALNKDIELPFLNNPTSKDMALFCRQFLSILKAGVPIATVLSMLSQQTEKPKLTAAIRDMQSNVSKGETLASSMRRQDKVFPSMLVNMVAAGEESGNLESSFSQMEVYFERLKRTKSKIVKVMIYPCVVLAVMVVVLIVMMTRIIPMFLKSFEDMGAELPFLTRCVMAVSDWFVAWWWALILGIAGLVVFCILFKKTDRGKHFFGWLARKIPVVKNLTVKSACATFARTMSILLGSGLTLMEALDLTADNMSNIYYKEAIQAIRARISDGWPLATSMKETGLFPPMICNMVAIGEETGDLQDMLAKVADYYDEEVTDATDRLTALIEPCIIIVLAVFVAIIVFSIFLPMMNMTKAYDQYL